MRVPLLTLILVACASSNGHPTSSSYFDNAGRDDVVTGGVKMIPVSTPAGSFRVWTKRVGNNPKLKVLLLNGGPGMTHEYFEAADSYFPGASVEYYYYDQLDTGNSDRPDKPELYDLARYVDEVEQVRKALKLDETNFILYGQSWGGLLAMEYAITHPDHLKGLIISNMMASGPAYNAYAHDVLMPEMDKQVLAEILQLEADKKYDDPRYLELLLPNYYQKHILQFPFEQWPEPVLRSFNRLNKKLYITMQGPSEMGLSGKLVSWDRFADLGKIKVPTLVIAAKHDTMDPAYMEKMAKQIKRARFVLCPNGSHLAMYDDPVPYWTGILAFVADVDASKL